MMKKILILFLLAPLFSSGSISACTGFTASNNENFVLVGSNEDWHKYDFWIRFLPAEHDTHGRIIFENHWPIEEDSNWRCPQNGMNDQGLFYDYFEHPPLLPVNSNTKPEYYNNNDHYKYSLESYCLSKCSTINQVIDLYLQYNLERMESFQVLWVDKYGDSVIIEGDDIVYKEGNYQVVTNFLHTHPELGEYPCKRYDTAVDMLEEMDELTIEYFTSICDATHISQFYPTVYSNIYDLNKGDLYLYYFYQYANVVKINLEEELSLGEHVYFLKDLFESNNFPPNKPSRPTGPYQVKIGEICSYQSQASDDREEQLKYLFDWNDGTYSRWLGPYGSGETCEASHIWIKQGNYQIRVKARDIYGYESEWSDPLSIKIPKNKGIENLFEKLNFYFKDRYSTFFLILKQTGEKI